ncbi:MAG: hypothetical protein Q9184_006641 [Pyrenodesmia sp. 2 TL-2023]
MLTNFAISCRNQEAEIKYWELLKGREKKLGLNHAHTRRTLERLAHMLWMQGLHDKAENVILKVLTKAGRLSSDYQLGSDCAPFGALTALYTDAQKRDRSKLAPDHIDALETCECLRLIYLEQGEYDKAKELTEQIQRATSHKEPEVNQAKPDEERASPSPESKEYDVEGSNHGKKLVGSLQMSVQQLQNTLPTTNSILLLILALFGLDHQFWLDELLQPLD